MLVAVAMYGPRRPLQACSLRGSVGRDWCVTIRDRLSLAPASARRPGMIVEGTAAHRLSDATITCSDVELLRATDLHVS